VHYNSDRHGSRRAKKRGTRKYAKGGSFKNLHGDNAGAREERGNGLNQRGTDGPSLEVVCRLKVNLTLHAKNT